MVFRCCNKECNEIWFIQRMYDVPRNNKCPQCGQYHFLHQQLSIIELEELVNKIRETQKDIENQWIYDNKYYDSLTQHLEKILELEIMVSTIDKLIE